MKSSGDITILDKHIEVTPETAGGKPRITGHRITVQDIVIWHELMGKSADEIASEYDLMLADIYAALAYYFDHRDEIDRTIKESEAFIKELSKLSGKEIKTGRFGADMQVSLINDGPVTIFMDSKSRE